MRRSDAQSVTHFKAVTGHRVSTASPQLTEHHRQTRPDRTTWSVGWGRWARRPVISCRQLDSLSSKHTAAGRPAGSTEPAANPLEMHRQTGKVGKVRAGVVWQMANRAAVGSSWKTKARRDRQTEGGSEGGTERRFVMQWGWQWFRHVTLATCHGDIKPTASCLSDVTRRRRTGDCKWWRHTLALDSILFTSGASHRRQWLVAWRRVARFTPD